MKRFFIILAMMLITSACFAQKDVTKFLGIPIDGFKSEMRQKLIAKGFTPEIVSGKEIYVGEFNGTDVNVRIVTNNNKVYRIAVSDANPCSEASIKIRFNNLVSQFENNKRYFAPENYTLSDDVDIAYEMKVHNKYFDAIFYQKSGEEDTAETVMMRPVWFRINEFYGEYYINMYYDNVYNMANGEDL